MLDYFNATNLAKIAVYSDSVNFLPTIVLTGMTFWSVPTYCFSARAVAVGIVSDACRAYEQGFGG